MNIIIEKNVPLPGKALGKWQDIVKTMLPKDSFQVANENSRQAATKAMKTLGYCYTTRKNNEGYRIWRTS